MSERSRSKVVTNVSDAIVDSAMLALEEGRPLDAITLLEPVIESDDEDVEALVCLGRRHCPARAP